MDQSYIASVAALAKEGDSDAFAEFFAATCQSQYALACFLLKNETAAQEVLQETYIRALKGISRLRDEEMAVTWLNQITIEGCLHALNKDTEGEMKAGGMRVPVRRVKTLPIAEAQAVLLYYLFGMRSRRIARYMDMPPGEVRRYRGNGLRRLRELEGGETE